MPKKDSQTTFWKGLSGQIHGVALDGIILVAQTEETDGERVHEFHDFYGFYEIDGEWAPFPTPEELHQLLADGQIIELVPNLRLPAEPFEEFTLTVKSSRVDADPAITIFHALLESSRGVWPETFGSVDQLQMFLKGLNVAFSQVGVFTHFGWHIPDTFSEPSGLRWTISKDGLPVQEELRSTGEVITI
jgi:hypothetical protein